MTSRPPLDGPRACVQHLGIQEAATSATELLALLLGGRPDVGRNGVDQADVRTEPTKNGAPGYPAGQVVVGTTEIHRWPGAYVIERSLASPDASWTALSGGDR
jgi:hypothetical protein